MCPSSGRDRIIGKVLSLLAVPKSGWVPLGISSCGEILISSNAVFGQLTILREPGGTASAADSAAWSCANRSWSRPIQVCEIGVKITGGQSLRG